MLMAPDWIIALVARHALIEGQLQSELCRPLPNDILVARLKRGKLAIRDELAKARMG